MTHTFEGWKFHAGAGGKEADDDCCCPESETTFGGDCVSCIDGTTPLKWAVTFNNVGNQDCLECTDFNATLLQIVVGDLVQIIYLVLTKRRILLVK